MWATTAESPDQTRMGRRERGSTPHTSRGTSPITYVGGTVLGRSTDRGHTFSVISPPDPDSLAGLPPPDEQDQGPFYANEYATISAIALSKTAPNTIYVGTDTGRVWRTTDLGASWTRLQGLPDRWVNSIVVDPTDASHAFVAFSGYREGDNAANIWMTTDGGQTWHISAATCRMRQSRCFPTTSRPTSSTRRPTSACST